MQKNENGKESKKPFMAVEFNDTKGKKMKNLFAIKAQRRILKCIEREIKNCGVVPGTILRYLISGGGKIDTKGDKDFKYLCPKGRKEKPKGFYRFTS